MKLNDINTREKNFHNKLQSKKKGRLENIFYKALYNLYEDFYKYLEVNCNNKVILDYGCGIGNITEKVARHNPSRIIGADISDVSIKKAIENSKKLNLLIEYKVENCESSSFESNTFDLVYGTGILHHLDLEISVKEINRLLKKNGKMIFVEPLGTNPIINLYRKITPNARSKDEHPFTNKDFELLNRVYSEVNIKYYGFLTLVFFPFYRSATKSSFFRFLSFLDQQLFKIKFLNFLAWSVLIVCKKN